MPRKNNAAEPVHRCNRCNARVGHLVRVSFIEWRAQKQTNANICEGCFLNVTHMHPTMPVVGGA